MTIGTCTDPVVLPPGGGTFQATARGASQQAGSCVPETGDAPEVVFRWTPTVSGTATITTCGAATTFDTVVYVRTGGCATGTEVVCNDDATGCATSDPCTQDHAHHGSAITAAVVAGQTYFIVVDGFGGSCGGDHGDFALTVVPPGG